MRIALTALAALCMQLLLQGVAHAASSSWNPTLLVNTEAFQTIDDQNSTANPTLQFGQSVQQQLYYDRSSQRFQFTNSINVAGNISATGSLTVQRSMSGDALFVSKNATFAGSGVIISASGQTVFNAAARNADFTVQSQHNAHMLTVDSSADRVGVGTAAPKATFDVVGTVSGSALTFMNGTSYFLGNLGIGKTNPKSALDVAGTISGSTVYANGALRSSGSIVTEGTISGANLFVGSSLTGAGLSDCSNATTSKLLWSASTGRFSCGTDQTGAGGGLTQSSADARYVQKSGGTMTGALNIRPTAGANALGLNVAAVMSGTSLQITGTGSADKPLLSTDQTIGALGIGTNNISTGGILTISGAQVLQEIKDPSMSPSAGTMQLYAKRVSGRMMLKMQGPSGVDYPYQPSFFQNAIAMVSASAGTTTPNIVGTAITVTGTVSHVSSETMGYNTNFQVASTTTSVGGFISTATQWYTGSVSNGSNGYFFQARGGVPTTNVGYRLFIGLSDQATLTTQFASDTVAGNYVGFWYSNGTGGRGDTAWQFVTDKATTPTFTNSTIAVTAGHLYDFYFYTPPFGDPDSGKIYWRVDDLSANTTQEGSTASNLPTGSTSLRIIYGFRNITGSTTRDIRMYRVYVEADK